MPQPASKKTATAVPKASRLPALGTLLGLGLFVVVAGAGTYYLVNRPVAADSEELDESEELALLEATEFSDTRDPQRLSTATMNEVVAAVHHETADGGPSAVIPARYAANPRPESNPAAWLEGTIEADSATEPAPWPHPTTGGSPSREFNRFTRK